MSPTPSPPPPPSHALPPPSRPGRFGLNYLIESDRTRLHHRPTQSLSPPPPPPLNHLATPPPTPVAPFPPNANPNLPSASAFPYQKPMAAAAGSLERWPGPPLPRSRKPVPGQPWSDLEIALLIDAYEERWYALKRGQLRAQQWEEVSAAVAARRGLEEPSKTGTQCRHKIEKLRKRYRAERQRPVASAWSFFGRMDRMERGPLPITVRPPAAAGRALDVRSSDDEDDEEEEDEEDERIGNNVRSINGILGELHRGPSRISRNHVPSKRRHFEVEEEEADESNEEESEGEALGSCKKITSHLAAVVRGFSEGLMRIEKRRMELMRELERDWMEMERKKAHMIRESEQCLLDMIADAFASTKKAKKS